jgi:hypothetical protein
MNAATIIASACSAVLLVAPPTEKPTYWIDDITDRDLTALGQHCMIADEVTVDDMKVVYTLHGHRLLLMGIEKVFEDRAKTDPNACVSWAEVVGEFHKCKRIGMKILTEGEKASQKNGNPAAAPTTRGET